MTEVSPMVPPTNPFCPGNVGVAHPEVLAVVGLGPREVVVIMDRVENTGARRGKGRSYAIA
jgi:hypothetical protein